MGADLVTGLAEPRRVRDLLGDLSCPWGIAGGWAVDLFLDRVTRAHKDIEVAVLRRDQLELRCHLSARGYSFEKVSDGRLEEWSAGESLRSPVHEIWARGPAGEALEILLNESTDGTFLFRRNPLVNLPLKRAFVVLPSGFRVLTPEVVLLYKAKRPEDPKERADFGNVAPRLDGDARIWLRRGLMILDTGHPWLAELNRGTHP